MGKQYWSSIQSKDCPIDLQEKAVAILASGLGDSALRVCMNAVANMMTMLALLDATFASKRAAIRIALLMSVFSKRYDESKNMSKFIDEFNQAFHSLRPWERRQGYQNL